MTSDLVMAGSYNYGLVALSILIAMLGSYATITLAARVNANHGGTRLSWRIGGSTAMAIGTWAMHYTGMLAFRLPIPILYDWPTALLSFLPSLLASTVALVVVIRPRMESSRAFVAGIFVGGGIAAQHYTAMASMRFQGMHRYDATLVLLSVLLAMTFALLSVWQMFVFRDERDGLKMRKVASVVLMGTAISAMHYSGMASASFVESTAPSDLSHAISISLLDAVGIGAIGMTILASALLTSMLDRMRKRKLLLDELFEQAPQAVALMSADDRVVRVNREFTKLFGYSPKEAIGRHLREMIVPEELQDEVQKFLDLSARGERVETEVVRRRKDGSRLHVSTVHVPLSFPGGQVARYAIYRDITERKQAENDQRRQREILQTIIDNIPVMIRFIGPDSSILVNRSWEQTLGWSFEELQRGKFDLFSELYPDPRERQRALEFVEAATGNWADFRIHVRDGRMIDVTVISICLSDGTYLSIGQDITERKLVEEQLQQSEERFRQMAESITEVFWLTNPDKKQILYVSPAYEKIWGRSRESAYELPITWLNAIHPDDRQRVERAVMSQQIVGGYDEEYRIIQPDGSVRWIRDRAFPINDAEGRVYRISGIAEDITARKLAEEKVKATSAQLRALSARLQSATEQEGIRIAREIHDELGAALSSLRWDLEDIDEAIPESAGHPDLEERRKKIGRMIRLIDTTINTVRRIASELRPIGLDVLGLAEAIKFHAQQFQDRTGIIVECDCRLENDKLSRERSTATFRIFQEALTNILRHSQATRVNIQMKEEKEEFGLTISDNGRGIKEDEKSGQLTLGLLGMRERAHLIGGKIEISGSDGKGTAVIVRIPIQAPNSKASIN